MPLGLGFAHPNSSAKFIVRVLEVGAEPAQAQGTPVVGPEVAQPPLVLRRPRVLVAVSARPNLVVRSLRMRKRTIMTLFWLI